jgi:hypothetical protein
VQRSKADDAVVRSSDSWRFEGSFISGYGRVCVQDAETLRLDVALSHGMTVAPCPGSQGGLPIN